MGFVHLHLHTEFSLLDGATRIDKLFPRIKELGQDAVAITEHGNMISFVNKYKLAKKEGVKLIFGVEVYVVDDAKKKEKGQKRYHLTILAENKTGFNNLLRLISESWMDEHFYYKPRVDKAMLSKYKDGLIVTTGCLASEVSRALTQDDYQKAKAITQEYIDIFGKDNVVVEIHNHGLPEQKKIIPMQLQLYKDLDLLPIAANDAHYLCKEDARAHEVMLCIQTKNTIDNPNRFKFDANEFYVKSEEEMNQAFDFCPQAVQNTTIIADRCNVELSLGTPIFPDFEIPQGQTETEYLTILAKQGLEEKYGGTELYEEAKERMKFELSVIENMGFPKYFLIVQDFVAYGKKATQVGPGRGSAAGSLVAYCLGITQVEPLKLGLLFERFLNPDRISLPDVDIDFANRDTVIDYVTQKYGKEKVAVIGTVGKMKAKAVLKDVARVFNVPFSVANEITKHVNEKTIQKSIDAVDEKTKQPLYPELKEYEKQYPEIFDIAKKLEGTVRHCGIHACGVVWGKDAITEYSACRVQDGQVVVQLDMNEAEDIGLVKFDFLGLETLNIIEKTLKYINKDNEWLENLPLDDTPTFELLQRGHTEGVFQLESQGMQHTLKDVKPSVFDDIIAIVSLYRPGPLEYIPVYARRKHGKEKVTYPCKLAEDILKPTYGIMVYQEQIMQMSVAMAGFTRGDSDVLRKAIGKKKLDLMQKMEPQFKKGCVEIAGMTQKAVDELWDDIVKFAAYSFNKSHAAAYALIAYRTAYLKAHYPVEFVAAVLSSLIRDPDKMSFHLEVAKSRGITMLAPDINKSGHDFTVEEIEERGVRKKAIRFGLSGIKFVGDIIIDEIVAKRPFRSFDDFMQKIDKSKINKRITECLIKAGCFDFQSDNRNQLLANALSQNGKKPQQGKQMTLFGAISDEDDTEVIPFTLGEKLDAEKDVLGVFVSAHPLDEYPFDREPDLEKTSEGYDITFMGLLQEMKKITTKRGDPMAFMTLSGRMQKAEIVIFPNVFEDLSAYLQVEGVCLRVEGTMSESGSILANRITRVPKKNGK